MFPYQSPATNLQAPAVRHQPPDTSRQTYRPAIITTGRRLDHQPDQPFGFDEGAGMRHADART